MSTTSYHAYLVLFRTSIVDIVLLVVGLRLSLQSGMAYNACLEQLNENFRMISIKNVKMVLVYLPFVFIILQFHKRKFEFIY